MRKIECRWDKEEGLSEVIGTEFNADGIEMGEVTFLAPPDMVEDKIGERIFLIGKTLAVIIVRIDRLAEQPEAVEEISIHDEADSF